MSDINVISLFHHPKSGKIPKNCTLKLKTNDKSSIFKKKKYHHLRTSKNGAFDADPNI
jgi:hypothetical protein